MVVTSISNELMVTPAQQNAQPAEQRKDQGTDPHSFASKDKAR
jgi:hypothetical protein